MITEKSAPLQRLCRRITSGLRGSISRIPEASDLTRQPGIRWIQNLLAVGAILRIFRLQSIAIGVQSRRGDHRIPDRQSIALRERQTGFVNLDVSGGTDKRPRIIYKNARASSHDMPILRRATLAVSFSTCTLIMPRARMSPLGRARTYPRWRDCRMRHTSNR